MQAPRKWAACAAALLIALPAYAADIYPAKPVRMVVGLPAGSSLDVCARAVAGKLAEPLGQNVVVDNQGLELSPSTPEQLGAQLRSDIARWGKVIRETGIRAN